MIIREFSKLVYRSRHAAPAACADDTEASLTISAFEFIGDKPTKSSTGAADVILK